MTICIALQLQSCALQEVRQNLTVHQLGLLTGIYKPLQEFTP